MTVEFYDAALRVLAAQTGVAVPRLAASPLPPTQRRLAVAVRAGRGGPVAVTVSVTDESGRSESGSDAAGLAAIGRLVGPDTDTPVCALVAGRRGSAVLGALARRHSRATDPEVATGAAVADWWAERSAHPGSGAVIDLVAASGVKYALGVAPGTESESVGVPRPPGGDRAEMVAPQPRIVPGDRIESVQARSAGVEDRPPVVPAGATALGAAQPRPPRETMGLAALRLRSRCDAAEAWEAALLGDRLWRRRAVHTGHVCSGRVIVGGTGRSARVEVVTDRFDVRMRAGTAVIGWAGPVDAVSTGGPGAFAGEVTATAVEGDHLRITLGGLGRRVPAADERVTLMGAPPSPSVAFATRSALRSLYRQASSWLARGTAPTPARRQVPLSVVVAAATDEGDH